MSARNANLARMRGTVDSAPMAEFAAALDHVNTIAEQAPGFAWRLSDETGSHVNLGDLVGDPLLIMNGIISLSAIQDYISSQKIRRCE